MIDNGKIKIVVADDSDVFRNIITEFLNNQDDLEVIGVASNGEEALKEIIEKKPDVVLIDILMPVQDGLWVLEELNNKGLHNKTVSIVVSALDSDNVAKRALAAGARYYVVKPFKLDILVRRIRQLYESENIDSMGNDNVDINNQVLDNSGETETTNLEKEITAILNKIGISASIKGYHFLRSAIIMAVEDENSIIGITKGMYPDIGKMYGTSASKVERAIRHAIESAWKKGGGVEYCAIIGSNISEKPTNGQLIASLSEYIKINVINKKRKTA